MGPWTKFDGNFIGPSPGPHVHSCIGAQAFKEVPSKRTVFFYTGNEADVELYVNATGWMWESAPEFGALLVFVEHRSAVRALAL